VVVASASIVSITTDIVSTLIEQTKLPSPLLTSRQIDEGSPVMSPPQYGDYQFDIYFDGLAGQLPKYPVDFASLARKAAEALALIYGPGRHTAAVWDSHSS
jgi:hypothetical protein